MPWTIDDVEEKIKGLSPKQKRVWVTVANGALERCLKGGGEQKECEASAIRQAHAVAKRLHENDEPFAIYWEDEEGWIIEYEKDALYELPEVEVFAVGTWNKDTYTEKDLDYMVEAFKRFKNNWTPVLKRGHQEKQEQPALGYITDLRRNGKKLMATISNIPKLVYTAIKKGLFKRVSAEIYWNYEDGETGKLYPRVLKALALLGTSIPAVSALKEIEAFFEERAIEIRSYEVDIEHELKIHEMEIKENGIDHRGNKNPNWKDGRDPEYYRGYLNDHKICEKCGKEKAKRVHHIDGDKTNSAKSNLMAVCNSCHMKIHNGNWKKNEEVDIIENKCKEKGKKMEEKDFETTMKTDGGVKYPKEAYLYVPDPEKPSTWKLRIWETPEQKVTIRQLGRAAAAFSPGGFRGQKVEIPTEDVAGIKAKLRAAYRKMGVEKEDMPKNIFEECETVVKGDDTMDFEKVLAEKETELEGLKAKLAEYEKSEQEIKIAEYQEKLEAKEAEIAELKKYEQEVKDLREKAEKLEEENKAYSIQLNTLAEDAKKADIKAFVEKHGVRGTKQILPKHEELIMTILTNCPMKKDYSMDEKEEKMSLTDMVRQFISELPTVVDLDEKAKVNTKEEKENVKAEVAERTNEYMEKHADVDYATAMKTVLAEDADLKERYFQAATGLK